MTPPSPEQLCERLLGRRPDAVEPLIVWDHRATYRCRIGTEEFVVKHDTDAREMAREAEGQTHAAANGIPVPELLAVEGDALAMRFVAGEALSSKSSDAAWRAAAAVTKRIHAAPPIGRVGGGFRRPVNVRIERAIGYGLDPTNADDIRQLLLDAQAVPATTWVHGDLQTDHFIVSDDDVLAVLDWSDHGLGDPLWDYTILTFDNPSKAALVLEEPPDPQRSALMRTERLLDDVRWFGDHGMVDALRVALAELNTQW